MKPGGKKFKWTQEQIEVVAARYVKEGAERLAEDMGIPYTSVKHMAKKLGLAYKQDVWTPERLKMLVERYQVDGPAVLAKEWGMTAFSVVARARRLGIGSTRKLPPKDFVWSDQALQAIRDRYIKEGGDSIAAEFNLNLGTVRRKASEMGLHTIAGHARAGKERAEKSDSLDIHYFDQFTQGSAYVFGFLMADGCINKKMTNAVARLAVKDLPVLEFIKRELKSNVEIYHDKARISKQTGNMVQAQVVLCLNSTVLVKRLMELGMKPRKTYNDGPFPDVPDEAIPHFVRGYLDGDGTININKNGVCCVGFVGSPRFITGLRDCLVRLAGMRDSRIQTKPGKTTAWSVVVWQAAEDIRRFKEFVYPEGFSFCLERKKQNLDKWLAEPRQPRGYYHRGRSKPNRNPSSQSGPGGSHTNNESLQRR